MKTRTAITAVLTSVAVLLPCLALAQTAPPPTADLNSSLPPPQANQPPPAFPAMPPAAPPAQVQAPTVGPAAHFYLSLAPHGTWMNIEPYGWVWQPAIVATRAYWRPYYDDGRWAWTGNGWYWHSTYAWGWAPFHYGRWSFAAGIGWVWIPALEWGPAWVEWAENDTCYGWAPLPPCAPAGGVTFGVSVGNGGVSWSAQVSVPCDRYIYVPRRHYGAFEHNWSDSWRHHGGYNRGDRDHDRYDGRRHGQHDRDHGDTVIIRETVVQQPPPPSAPARRPNEISRVVAPKPPTPQRQAPRPAPQPRPVKKPRQDEEKKPASGENSKLPAPTSRAMRVARLLAK